VTAPLLEHAAIAPLFEDTGIAPLLGHAGIAALIPHSGSMCLLESLLHWDHGRIVCSASSHRDASNPLRTASGLLAPCAIESAAQAMALHGALIGHAAGTSASPGYLASARGVRLNRMRLDDLDGDLRIEATRSAGDATQILYAFAVSHDGATIADGRATVVLNTALILSSG
jgi:predicted hotdog family 3-hydroxylacyl-ACP dehydratase